MCKLHIHEHWSLCQLSAGEQQGASLSSGLILGFPGIHLGNALVSQVTGSSAAVNP